MQDFEKIAVEAKNSTSKINENNFVARLVICYENAEKEKHIESYNQLVEFTNELDKINFNYRCKENKYFYLLNKCEFEKIDQFMHLREVFGKADKDNNTKLLTINLKNFNNYKDFLNLVIKVLKTK